MRRLYHHQLCPLSRKVRVVLAEKRLEFESISELGRDRRENELSDRPQETPLLTEDGGIVLIDSSAICEYLEEVYPTPPLMPSEPLAKAETRRLVAWFDSRFHSEVTLNLVGEKIYKRLVPTHGQPDSRKIRLGYAAIRQHLDYIAWLAESRTWLAGPHFSLADIAAATQISCIDYIGDVPWDKQPQVKEWYARVKSRPAFRALLTDLLPGIPPPRHYADLDF